MLETSEIKKRLKMAFWDYHYSEDSLYNVLYEDAQIPHLTKERIYQRLLETYSWYKILELVPIEQLKMALSDEIIGKLRGKPLQKRYFHVARILRKTTLPITR
jgi:hypothetical protein